jgi:hypothetical protein
MAVELVISRLAHRQPWIMRWIMEDENINGRPTRRLSPADRRLEAEISEDLLMPGGRGILVDIPGGCQERLPSEGYCHPLTLPKTHHDARDRVDLGLEWPSLRPDGRPRAQGYKPKRLWFDPSI